MQQFRIRIVQIPRWQVILIAAVVLAFLVALFVVAFGIFLLVLPVFLVMGVLAYFFGAGRAVAPGRETRASTIDGEYQVIEERRLEHERDR